MKLKELKQKYADAFAEVQRLKDVVENENRAFSGEEKSRWDKAVKDCERLKDQIDVLEKAAAVKAPEPLVQCAKVPELGLTEKEKKNYSLIKAIKAALSGDWSKAGFEREVSVEASKRWQKQPQGFFVPFEILKRDLLAGTDNVGGYTVQTDVLSGSFIDLLRKRTVSLQAGAQLLQGLQGNVLIPKLSSDATGYWVSENGTLTESTPSFAQVKLSPKTLGTYIDFSRTLLLQSTMEVEALCKDILNKSLSVALDAATLKGSGSNGEPTGILNTTGIGAVNWSTADTPSYGDLVDMETEVAKDNALAENMIYVFNSVWQGKCKQTAKVSSTDSRMIMENGEINGYKCLVSEQMTDSTVIFGNFADLLIGIWGNGLDILVDPYTGSASATTRVRALMDCDVAVRNASSFCKGTNS